MSQGTTTTRRPWWPLLLAASVVAALLLVTLSPGTSYVVRLLTGALAQGLLLRRARHWDDAPSRVAVRLLTAGLFAGVVSGLVAAVQLAVTGRTSGPDDPAELLYLVYAPLTVAGLFLLPWRRRTTSAGWRTLADAVAAGGALTYLALTIGGTADLTATESVVTHAYAALPAAVVAVALSVLPQVVPTRRRFVLRLAVAVGVLGLADIAYCLAVFHGTYSPTSWIGVLYEVALLLVVRTASAVTPDAADPPAATGCPGTAASTTPPSQQGMLLVAWPHLAAAAAVLVAAARTALGLDITVLELAALLLMVAAVIGRQLAHNAHLHSLLGELSAREVSAQQRLRADDVTGLPNRLALVEHVSAASTAGTRCALAVLDVRGFRTLNDNHGHAAGDELLRALGERLASRLPEEFGPETVVARVGSDEFAVLAPCTDDGQHLLDRVRLLANTPVALTTGPWRLAASVGLTVVPGGGDVLHEDGRDLLVEADLALATAQEESEHGDGQGDGTHLLDATSRHRARRRAKIREALVHPDVAHFDVVLQPIVDLVDGTVVEAEALLRWDDPGLGVVGPQEFVPIAERTGSILTLTDLVLHRAATAVSGLHAAGRTELRVAVNLSARDLADPFLAERAALAFTDQGVSLASLVVEVTEEGLLRDFDVAAEHLAHLQAFGVGVAVDDFGTGYCSLRYLRAFRPDVIKIDREFVVAAEYDPTSRLLVRKVNEIAQEMGGLCVAEGIEDAASADTMRSLGIRLGQGYHFARPMPVPALHDWLARSERLADAR